MTAPARVLHPHIRDLGGFSVRRLLPAAEQRTVGPFVFFDHMGPVSFAAGQGIDVRPHPHIGLATVTFLFEGAILHRDSLGNVQRISAGDVNWMTAGRGIVHSERTAPDDRAIGRPLHGLQTWVGLPLAHEETEPSFTHLPASALPRIEREGVQVIVVAGSAFGQRAPTPVFSATLYAATLLAPGASITLDTEHEQRAVYAVEGDIDVDGERIGTTEMAVLPADVKVSVGSAKGGKAMIVGGAPLDGTRFVWWNFVASSREKIEAAKQRWLEQQFGRVPGETEFIPLPDTPVPPSPPASPNQTPPAPPFS